MYKLIIAIIISMAVMASPVQAAAEKEEPITAIIEYCNGLAEVIKDIVQVRKNGATFAEVALIIANFDMSEEEKKKRMRRAKAVYSTELNAVSPERAHDLVFTKCYEANTE